jgi:hypothetical protein
VLTLLFLFVLALFNRFLGILKLQLDLRRARAEGDISGVPHLNFPPPRWPRHRISKDRESPLPPDLEVNHGDSDRSGTFLSAPLLGVNSRHYSDKPEESHHSTSYFAWWSTRGRRSWRQDAASCLIEGLRAFIGYLL